MWLVKLIYLILIIGLMIFSVLYIDSLAIILLLCVLIIPAILKICLLWLKLRSQASLNCSTATCISGQSVPVSVVIDNHSPLFFPKAYATVSVCHAFSDTPEKIRQRLLRAKVEVQNAHAYEYFVVNNTVENAVGELSAIITAEHCKPSDRMEILA